MIPAWDEHTLVGFARACLEPVLGGSPRGWFFLAGGAFKSLLHGRPPWDLDLWPATAEDRDILSEELTRRGAMRVSDHPPYQTTFILGEHTLELAYDVSPRSLEERLARSDLALSAVGVEHRQGQWRAIAHPLARASIERGEVLALWPLVNWKYALATLERLRRYAMELGYAVPVLVEQEIWALFDGQPQEEQVRMIERYVRVSRGDGRVLEEARHRMYERSLVRGDSAA
jgi:hypothetical protein